MRLARRRRGAALAVLVSTAFLARFAAAQGVVADLAVTELSSERVLFLPAVPTHAVVVLLTGGTGIIRIGAAGAVDPGDGFLIRTRGLWAAHGIAAVLVGPPNGAPLLGQRHTAAYAAALDAAVDFATLQASAPVWLLGTSQGSIAAANGAARLGDKVAGVVLMSSITKESGTGETVFDANPGAIKAPALVVANAGDACRASPPGGGPALLAALVASPRRELVAMDSKEIRSDPCAGQSPHSYFGIESATIDRVAEWIVAAPGR